MIYKPHGPLQNSGLLFAKGEDGAMAMPQSPGTTQAIFDIDDNYVYITTMDMVGVKSMRKFETHEVELEGGAGTVSRKEFNELANKINSLYEELGGSDGK